MHDANILRVRNLATLLKRGWNCRRWICCLHLGVTLPRSPMMYWLLIHCNVFGYISTFTGCKTAYSIFMTSLCFFFWRNGRGNAPTDYILISNKRNKIQKEIEPATGGSRNKKRNEKDNKNYSKASRHSKLRRVLCSKHKQSKFNFESRSDRNKRCCNVFKDQIISSHPNAPSHDDDNLQSKGNI